MRGDSPGVSSATAMILVIRSSATTDSAMTASSATRRGCSGACDSTEGAVAGVASGASGEGSGSLSGRSVTVPVSQTRRTVPTASLDGLAVPTLTEPAGERAAPADSPQPALRPGPHPFRCHDQQLVAGLQADGRNDGHRLAVTDQQGDHRRRRQAQLGDVHTCLLYTSDAADEEDSVDLGGR